jgi:hypothetical protein
MFIYDGLPQTNEAARRLVNARSAKMASRAKATFIRCCKLPARSNPFPAQDQLSISGKT